MIPTSRQVALWGVPLVLAVLAVGVRPLQPAVLAFDLAFALVLTLDALRAGGRLEVRRRTGEVYAVGAPGTVQVEVDNPGRRTVQLRIRDEAPGETEGLPLVVELAPRGRLLADYRLTFSRRGREAFGDLVVRVASPWGLWERQTRHSVDTEVRVYPDLRGLRSEGLAGRALLRDAPVRVRRQAGGENEFQRNRPYVTGDAFRHIDWKATARKRRPITREFGQESNQNVVFVLDAGRMMTAPMGELTAFDHALGASLLLGQEALRRGDRVGLLAFDETLRSWVPPRSGRGSSGRLLRATFDLEPRLVETDFQGAFRHLAAQVRRRSLIVISTSVVDAANGGALAKVVRILTRRHLVLIVWLRDPEVDRLLRDGDAFERAAAIDLDLERAAQLTAMQRAGALVVDVPLAELTGSLLARYVEIKARRLL